MKTTKKLAGILLALVMVLAMTVPAFALEVSPTANENKGSGSITITNTAKGITYKLYRLFDATVSVQQTGGEADSIAYTGTIPDSLKDYFETDTNGFISAKDAAWTDPTTKAEMSEALRSKLQEWAENETEVASAKGDGSELKFINLKYGYYVIISSQGTAVSVDSTNPNATIVDKNSTEPTGLTKTVDNDNVNIGDTVTYTVTFKTSVYYGAGADAKKIISYTITDTLPDFLASTEVKSVVIDNDGNTGTTGDQTSLTPAPQFSDKKIVIDWYDEANNTFLYDNGATVTITYSAVVTDSAAIDGEGNTNTVTLQWTTEGSANPEPNTLTASEIIYTYAIALKKVDQKGNPLTGATFEFPFYVKENADTDGAYIYAGTTAGAGLTNQITTPDDGVITVKGVAEGTYNITETEAPSGYNKLAAPVSVTAVKTGETATHTTIYLDDKGNIVNTETSTKVEIINNDIAATAIVVVNKTGTELPSTGGVGTTVFYIVGGVLLVGAGVLLVVRKRMSMLKEFNK